jgi:hypothetical protein
VNSEQKKQEHKDEYNTIIETKLLQDLKFCSRLLHIKNGVIRKVLKVQSILLGGTDGNLFGNNGLVGMMETCLVSPADETDRSLKYFSHDHSYPIMYLNGIFSVMKLF